MAVERRSFWLALASMSVLVGCRNLDFDTACSLDPARCTGDSEPDTADSSSNANDVSDANELLDVGDVEETKDMADACTEPVTCLGADRMQCGKVVETCAVKCAPDGCLKIKQLVSGDQAICALMTTRASGVGETTRTMRVASILSPASKYSFPRESPASWPSSS